MEDLALTMDQDSIAHVLLIDLVALDVNMSMIPVLRKQTPARMEQLVFI
jgi:hypothetical protein